MKKEILKTTYELFGNAIWIFGSELAILRIAIAYKDSKQASHGFSANLCSHYFKLELPE